MTANAKLEAAVEYAGRGWLVFPVHSIRPSGSILCTCGRADCSQAGKHPRTANGLRDASLEIDKIRTWWTDWPGANIGVATGHDSGIVVIDIDPRHGGFESLNKLELANGPLPETTTGATGGGGEHRIFAHPDEYISNDSLGKKLGKGLDVRGEGGYIIAPPSNHKSGGVYGWRSSLSPDDMPPTEMPAWLVRVLAKKPEQAPELRKTEIRFNDGSGKHWLEKALARAVPGERNEVAFWLACQLRDSQIPTLTAEDILRTYAASVPQGDEPFSEREALTAVRSAYARQARPPAKSETSRTADRLVIRPTREIKIETPSNGAAKELSDYMAGVMSGAIVNVPFPWRATTNLTQALLPGSIMSLCGDPGVGKTFWVLQCLQFWFANGFEPRTYFIEKNRRFHTHRLLAQLEGNGSLIDFDWIPKHQDEVNAALARHGAYIDELGRCIASRAGGRITLNDLVKWLEQCAKEKSRVWVIDPITMASAGAERWMADDAFVDAAQQIAGQAGASLVICTHPRKGNRQGRATGHDQAGGAAYHRFVDSVVWIHRPPKPRHVRILTSNGPCTITPDVFFQLEKTRDGKGSGLEIAMRFKGNGLQYKEEGIVEKDVKRDESEAA